MAIVRITERATSRVEINRKAFSQFYAQHGPVAAELLDLITEVMVEVKKDAPRAAKKTHGRAPGYLRARLYARFGATVALGPYADIVSPAASPQGYRYASKQEKRKDYLHAPLARVMAKKAVR